MFSLHVALLCAVAIGLSSGQSCAPGSFSSNGACKPCPPGTLQTESNKKSCDPCRAGTFRPFAGGFYYTQCLTCPAGTTSKPGATSCTKCPKNTFSRAGWSRCVARCKPGHGLGTYNEACELCNPSTFNDGTFFECRRCPSGTSATQRGTVKCAPCAPGTFRDMRFVSRIDISKCFDCPVNTFSARPGARQCALCPPGTVAKPGATGCTSCPAGTFRFGMRYKECIKCPKGTWSVARRPARCKHPKKGCPFGTFLAEGACRACLPGERLDASKLKCVPCPPGRVSRGGSSTRCEACPENEEPEDDLSIYERARCRCKTGWQRDASGRCRRCGPGESSDHRPAGAIWDSNWRVSYQVRPYCQRCYGGEIVVDGGSRCGYCPIGQVPKPDGNGCAACPKGTIAEPGELIGKEAEDRKENPHRSGCVRLADGCEVGTFLLRSGSCKRFACPPNTALTSYGSCVHCNAYERFEPGTERCMDCPEGTANPLTHIRQQCTRCGPNARREFGASEKGGCVCKSGFVRRNGACVACLPGTVATKQGCLRCASGTWTPRSDGFGDCGKCPGALVLRRNGMARCVRCQPGFTRAFDMLGEGTEMCMPVGGYFPVSFKGRRVM